LRELIRRERQGKAGKAGKWTGRKRLKGSGEKDGKEKGRFKIEAWG